MTSLPPQAPALGGGSSLVSREGRGCPREAALAPPGHRPAPGCQQVPPDSVGPGRREAEGTDSVSLGDFFLTVKLTARVEEGRTEEKG